ncbi:MAG: outer membrane beta-barrel protein [Flavobacteriales bacterium]|nr:outer membrane beta-barrel protein [Flavobacteriales bacterium]
MKIIVVIFLSAIAGIHAHAQFEVHPLVGVNFGEVQEEPNRFSTTAQVGYQFGGNFLIGGRIHLYPGVTYNHQVTEYVDDQADISVDQTVAGVEIPLCIGFKVINPEFEDFINFRVFAGPSLNFHTTTEYSEGILEDEINWNEMTWGARLGAGFNLGLLFANVSYDIGLSDVHDHGENVPATGHNTLLINGGIKLKLSK